MFKFGFFVFKGTVARDFLALVFFIKGTVPHSGSGVAPMSSLSGVELLGFWEFGVGGLIR
jgi:hypothetical protein